MPSSNAATAAARAVQRGTALATAVHVLLLLVVLGQIVYLASRHRLRFDLTSDRLWSLTESTREILGKLDKRLVIEAYFSPKEKLPVALRDTRTVLDAMLDEFVQLGRGRIVVQRFDPLSDKAIADKCTRIGVQPANLRSGTATSVSVDQHWQGLRLVYGGGKQKVIPQVAPQSSFLAEAVLTPAVKEVATEQKRKLGYMEWPAQAIGQQQPGGIGWNVVRTHEAISKRYEFQNYKDEDGALLPADCETLFLFRPKDLTDRQKYVVDQFVVRGGTLVVLADAAEYAIGQRRQCTKVPLALDAPGSTHKLTDQLAHYGIDWKPKVLADLAPEAYTPRDVMTRPFEYFGVLQQGLMGQQIGAIAYQYFFHAVAGDWARAADALATDERGQRDAALADQYRALFKPGLPSDEFLFKAFKQTGRGPGLYWPTWIGLRTTATGAPDLPEGIDGRVLMWSSPKVLAEDPPANVDPIGAVDGPQRRQHYDKFQGRLLERLRAEPRQQAPLMASVQGRFTSFFAGREVPKRPSQIKEEEEEKKKAAEAKPADEAAKDEAAANEAKPAADPIGPEPPKPVDDAASKAPPEPAMLERAEKPGRIIAIGDADFLRDDLVRGDYQQLGGPVSATALPFMMQLLDWLAEDRDLVELQSRVPVDRTLRFVDPNEAPAADPRVAEQQLERKTTVLRTLNTVLPMLALGSFGLLVFLLRRAQKRSFLESVANGGRS
jgi:ABC-type uncharacterized transport system involved in gliding motility auxiliary subunit